MALQVSGPPDLVNAIGNLLRIFVPDPGSSQLVIELDEHPADRGVRVICRVGKRELAEQSGGQLDSKRLARVAFVTAMGRVHPEVKLPWGILTGVRPTKMVHRLLDLGYSQEQAADDLRRKYLVDRNKAALALEVAARQRPYLLTRQQAVELVSIYIGIPFCPSRCVYCSFPSSVGGKFHLEDYLTVLGREIAAVGSLLKTRNIGVQTLYIGGGTPTLLAASQLAALLAMCHKQLLSPATVEITVEAGRPDTIDRDKLSLLKTMGVGRLSINPQSMSARTLEAIGRRHTPEQVVEAYYLAKQLGFNNINMDIILGLPGETLTDVAYTLEQLTKLQPESLTVHSLAVKRASALRQGLEGQHFPRGRDAEQMQELAGEGARSMGLRPYYLYRQKQIVGNLENVGYARQGKESVYNIQIMEERQTVLALGAGAASKIVNPQDWSLVNIANAKQPEVYYNTWQEKLRQKVSILSRFNGQA